MNVLTRIISERAVLLLVLVILIVLVSISELIGVTLSEFAKFLITAVVSFFFGQSMPSQTSDVEQLG